MRATGVLAGLLVIAGAAQAQQRTLLITFANGGTESGGSVDQAIADRNATRAWQDSVEVYLDRENLPQGWRLAPRGTTAANYMVSVVAVPITGNCRGTAMALVIFEPGGFGGWKYLTSSVAITAGAQAAADQMSAGAINSLRAIGR